MYCDLCGEPMEGDNSSRFQKKGVCFFCESRERRRGGYWFKRTHYTRDRYDGIDPFNEED